MHQTYFGMRRSLLLGLFFLLAHSLVSHAQTRVNRCGEGTRIILESGSLTPGACGENLEDSQLKFRALPFYTTYAVVVTDDEFNILAITRNRVIDFSTLPGGSYRVYGLFYNGTLLAEPGMNPDRDRLGTICYGFTDNFIEINSVSPEGGLVSTASGLSEATLCADPSASQDLAFANTSNSAGDYQYIVTDTTGKILALPTQNQFDFSETEVVLSRVYGLAYTGDLNVGVGDQLDIDATLATGCSSLSDNFIRVRKVLPQGGTLSFADGTDNLFICAESVGPIPVETREASSGAYAYFVTGRNDVVVDIIFEQQIDLSTYLPDKYRVYGAAYTGNLQVKTGDDIRSVAISDDCFDLSDNFLSLTSPNLSTSGFRLSDGTLSATLCRTVPGNTQLSFTDDGEGGIQNKVYILTQPDSTVLDIFIDNTIDFAVYNNPELLVWSLAYTGSLFLKPGDRLESLVYASECAVLAEQPVVVRQVFLDGGGIRLENGATAQKLCFEADLGRTFTFDFSDLSGGEKALFATDTDGNILDIQESDSLVITPDLPLDFQVYGVVYSGGLRLNLGNNINNNPLSTECFERSTNAVSFTTDQVEGSSITLSDGSTQKDVCVMDEEPNVLTFDASRPSTTANYRFVLTDDTDRIILALAGNSLDFNLASTGVTRIYGVSYTGDWIAGAQENILTTTLSDQCFDLSDNYIEVNQFGVEAGTVSFADGSTTQTVCTEGQADAFSFTRQGDDSESYAYLITDMTNELIAIAGENGQFSLGDVLASDLRVWGLAYYGQLSSIPIGTEVTSVPLSDQCFDLSDNFLSITRILPEAGSIRFVGGDTRLNFCSQELSRMANVQNDQGETTAYAYLITDQTNVVQAVSETDDLVFDNLELGNYRIWGLAYTGTLTVQPGDHAPETILSDDCFDLSDNFLEVTIDELDAGALVLSNGETEYYVCQPQDEVIFNLADNPGAIGNYRYLVLSLDQEILAISEEARFRFSEIAADEFLVRGLNYNGDLLIEQGDDFSEDSVFSTVCYALSDNAIYVAITLTEGGFLSLENGGGVQTIDCNNPDQLVDLSVTGASEDAFVYYLSNAEEEILAIQDNDQFDLTAFPNGTYHLRGAAYSGDLLLQTGQNAQTASISTGCFDVSDNTVAVNKQLIDGGTITGPDGAAAIIACAPDDLTQVEVLLEGNLGAAFAFLLTDTEGNIQQVSDQTTLNLDFAGADTLLIYTLAYNGSLLAAAGSTINDNLSDDCFELSENPLLLLKASPAGGTISLVDGTANARLCANSTDVLAFNVSGEDPIGTYYFLLATEDNEFIAAYTSQNLDVAPLEEGNYHIWGVSSSGPLVVQVGDDVTNSQLSNDCFDLSDNFVNLLKTDPLGGLVATIAGAQSLSACPQQGIPNIVEFESLNTMNTGEVAFLLADENNILIDILETAQVDLDTLPVGNYILRSLTYNGEILLTAGDTLGSAPLASACGSLSENQVDLNIELPIGGQISGNGLSGNKICINNIDTKLKLEATGQSTGTNYTYLVTNDVDEFLFELPEGEVDLDFVFQGDLKVWGLAYTGELTVNVLDNINNVALANDCYDLSDNVLTIVKEDIDGGLVSTVQGATAAYACPGDGNPDLVTLTNSSTSGTANYAYIITTTDNLIFTAINGNERNFDNIGAFRELRVWGVSYTGTLNIPVFADLFSTVLSEGCYDISDNYVAIFRDEPEAASAGTIVGDQDILLCPGANDDVVQLTNTSTSLAGYAYLIVDAHTDSTIVDIITDSGLNIRNMAAGDYLMYGLSYTGNILVVPGDTFNIDAAFADNCFELTASAVDISIGGEVDGGMLTTPSGKSLFYSCPFDNAGEAVVVNTPAPIEGTGYRLVITDENNNILFPEIQEGLIPFDGADSGEYRIWGISFTGDYRGQFGLNILEDPLSTDCYAPSDNFITVISLDPEAGQISTTEGNTQVEVTNEEPLILNNTAASPLSYRYLLTSEDSTIVATFESDTLDLSGLTDGAYLVFGVTNAGDFTAVPGQHVFNDQLAENCYALSENNIMLTLNKGDNAQRPGTEEAVSQSFRSRTSLQVFPNPATDYLNLRVDVSLATPLSIRLFNRNGQLVLQRKVDAYSGFNQYHVALGDLPADLYLIQVQGNQYQHIKRFIKE